MLSICVNVKNGARYLSRCLSSLAKFEDVVLLDNYSTDNTIEIAKTFSNVRIYQCEFNGMGMVRNLAASYAKNDWVLFVDCDEVLEAELVDILLYYKFDAGNIYNIYRKNYYDGALVESSAWGNDWIKRLYSRLDTKFAENQVHDNFVDNLTNIKITGGSMIHFPYEQVNQLIDKMQFYSTLYAKQHHTKKHPKLWLIPFRMLFMFIKCYILKCGFKDGYEGLTISMFNAIGVWSKYIKLYELDYKKKFALAIHVNSLIELESISKLINQQSLLSEAVVVICDLEKILDEQLLKSLFIVENYCIDINDYNNELNTLLKSNDSFDYIVECLDSDDFTNKNFVSNIRTSLQHHKPLNSIKIFTK